MGEALELFVDKKNIYAIKETAGDILTENQKILIKRGAGDDGKAAVDNPTSVHEFLGARADKNRADFEIEREDAREEAEAMEEDEGEDRKPGKRGKGAAAAARKRA